MRRTHVEVYYWAWWDPRDSYFARGRRIRKAPSLSNRRIFWGYIKYRSIGRDRALRGRHRWSYR